MRCDSPLCIAHGRSDWRSGGKQVPHGVLLRHFRHHLITFMYHSLDIYTYYIITEWFQLCYLLTLIFNTFLRVLGDTLEKRWLHFLFNSHSETELLGGKKNVKQMLTCHRVNLEKLAWTVLTAKRYGRLFKCTHRIVSLHGWNWMHLHICGSCSQGKSGVAGPSGDRGHSGSRVSKGFLWLCLFPPGSIFPSDVFGFQSSRVLKASKAKQETEEKWESGETLWVSWTFICCIGTIRRVHLWK